MLSQLPQKITLKRQAALLTWSLNEQTDKNLSGYFFDWGFGPRILNTLLFLAVYRLGFYIVLPGVDGARFQGSSEGIFGLLDTLVGGAFSNASIFGLSIMPYISASIVLQLLTVAVPYFFRNYKRKEKMGRKKIDQYTRVLTVGVCLAQSAAYIASNISAEYIFLLNFKECCFAMFRDL